jgi:hypothetical protein
MPINMAAVSSSYPSILGVGFRGMLMQSIDQCVALIKNILLLICPGT